MTDKYKKNLWGWVWTEAGQQTALEEAMRVGGFGYPAMIAYNARKLKYSTLKGSFDEVGLGEFLRSLSLGRGSTEAVAGGAIPPVQATPAWDGLDGALPEEDDIDLSDVDMDDDVVPDK